VVSSTPRPHFPPGKDPVPILQEIGWAPGPFWTGEKSCPHRDSIPDRRARSQSLYRLSYPAHWSCPEGSRKLRFPDFITTAQDGGKVVSQTHRITESSWFYHKQVACNVLTKRPVVVITLHLITFNAFKAELNPICPLLALFGAHHILHVSRIRVRLG